MTHTIDSISQELTQGEKLIHERLHLLMGDCHLEIHSNSKLLIAKLHDYFTACNVIETHQLSADVVIVAIERDAPELDLEFIDWKREADKTGRKDEYFDINRDDCKAARVVRKVRTGMVFLQSEQTIIAAGPCIKNDNQIINFTNSQYMNWLQQKNWVICHASGLVYKGEGLAMAGFSGGGKSTLMLHLMNNPAFSFVSNDRLFIHSDKQTKMSGIAKLPRINPGTIVANPVLHSLMSSEKITDYQSMETSELWDIEDKYDVPINKIYGDQRIQYNCPLKIFIVLNWQRDSNEPVQLSKVDLGERRDLLKAIMKASGPFYINEQANFQQDNLSLDENAYLPILSKTTIYEAHGGVDFNKLSELCMAVLN